MGEDILRLMHVAFAYRDGASILEGLDFTLRRGARVGLIGPNGCGKTTLFSLIMGLVRPTTGTIEIFGRPRQREKDFLEVRQRIGLLFQDSNDQLFSPTVLEDVAFGPLNLGKGPQEARRLARDTLRMLRLEGFEQRISHKLSHGEKKLVALATILAMQPEVIILDEPSAGLDTATVERLIGILDELRLTTIVTSHDMDFLLRTTDTLCALRQGRIETVAPDAAHTHVHVHPAGSLPHGHSNI